MITDSRQGGNRGRYKVLDITSLHSSYHRHQQERSSAFDAPHCSQRQTRQSKKIANLQTNLYISACSYDLQSKAAISTDALRYHVTVLSGHSVPTTVSQDHRPAPICGSAAVNSAPDNVQNICQTSNAASISYCVNQQTTPHSITDTLIAVACDVRKHMMTGISDDGMLRMSA